MLAPAAVRMRTVASVIDGPMPSPGIKVTGVVIPSICRSALLRGTGPDTTLTGMPFGPITPSLLTRSTRQLQEMQPLLRPVADTLYVRDGATLESQLRIAQLAAPTGGEQRRGALVADAFRLRGFQTVTVDAVGNVIARRPGRLPEQPPVVCMAHLDTVFPEDTPIAVRQEGDRIICPGIGDNARGVAGMLAVADALGIPGLDGDAAALTRPIEFVATVGEEGLGNLKGARAYFDTLEQRGERAHAVVALDGPGDDRIVHHALGARRVRIVFQGPGGHSWANYGTPNAVHAAAHATHWLASLPASLPASYRGALTVTVGRIGGGSTLTAIPEHAWLEVDIRGTSERVLARAERELRRIVEQAVAQELQQLRVATDAAPLTASVTALGDRPAASLPADHPVVTLAIAATHAIGRVPQSARASTDANVPMARGIPAITIGAGGRGGGAHTSDEWYENVDGARGLERAMTILATLAA